MLEDESERVVDLAMRMPDGTIEHYYMRVAKEVPDFIVRQMIDEAVYNIRKGIASWH